MWKVAGTVGLFATVGLPITGFADFLVFALAFLVLCFSPLTQARTGHRMGLLIVVVVLTGVSAYVLPVADLEEGQGIYTPDPEHALANVLPAEVLDHLERSFAARYPRSQECTNDKQPCWLDRLGGPPSTGFAFSSESIARPAKYTRVVNEIDFDSRFDLPLVALNDLRYNVFPPYARTWVRRELPYFVFYELPPAVEGGELCWRGRLYIESPRQGLKAVISQDERCLALTSNRLPLKVYGVEVPGESLSMRLRLPGFLLATEIASRLVAYVGATAVVFLLVGVPAWRRLILPFGSFFATWVWVVLIEPTAITGVLLHYGGSDGLGYEAFARGMAQAAANGDWHEALRGGQSIFWSMPGLRYFLAVNKPFFGDTFYAYFLASVFLPIIVYRLLGYLVSPRASAVLTGLFLLTPLFEYFRFTHYIYLKLSIEKNLAETLGYTVFLCALVLVLDHLRSRTSNPKARFTTGAVFLIGFCGFAAIALRPNLGPAAGVLLSLVGLMTLARQDWPRLFVLCLGFTPIALLGLHNYAYGGEFHLLTQTGRHPANLEMPPEIWLRALGQLWSFDFSGAPFQRMLKQLHTWNSPDEFYRVIVFAVVFWAAFSKIQPTAVRLIALMALLNQATLFFFHASGRYAFLAWFLTFVAFMPILLNQIWPWVLAKRRTRNTQPTET